MAGSRPPDDLRPRLVALTLEQLSPLTTSDRWVIVLEALAFAPIHNEVVPTGVPATVSPELIATVQRLAPAIPRIAALFGVEIAPKAQMPRPLRNEWRDKKAKATKKPAAKPASKPTAKPATVSAETVPTETVPTETVPVEATAPEAVPTEAVPTETVPTETVPTEIVPVENTAISDNFAGDFVSNYLRI